MIGDEEFILKAAGSKTSAKNFFKVMQVFKGMKETDDMMGAMGNFTEDTTEALLDLIKETLKVSYPDEPEADMDQFANTKFMELLPVVFKLYSPESKDEGIQDKIEAFKKARTC